MGLKQKYNINTKIVELCCTLQLQIETVNGMNCTSIQMCVILRRSPLWLLFQRVPTKITHGYGYVVPRAILSNR